MFDLTRLGFCSDTQRSFQNLNNQDLIPARVAIADRDKQWLLTEAGPRWSTSSGRLRQGQDQPAVGDWVACRTEGEALQTVAVLPRRSVLERVSVGAKSRPQTIAANLDRVFIVTAVGADFSPRRLERYLSIVWQGGAAPVIVVTKTDLAHDEEALSADLDEVAIGVPVARVNTQGGYDELQPHLVPGETVALVGSSGVGKSTIINALMGSEHQSIFKVRTQDDKGRHTTTRRELMVLDSGVIVIDTPGMRALGVSADVGAVQDVFLEVEAIAENCRFSDCEHQGEPGCAVQAALQSGELSEERWQSRQKLVKEAAYETARRDAGATYDTKRRWKQIHLDMRERKKFDTKLR